VNGCSKTDLDWRHPEANHANRVRTPLGQRFGMCNHCRRKRSKEVSLRKRNNKIRIAGIITVLAVAGTMLCSAAAQKASVLRQQNALAMGEDQIRQLLLLMPTDSNGMVSRQEYMKFMEAEFNRLDKEKKGELDARKLAQSNFSASRFAGK
jgi:hypothetical protein